MTYYCAIDIGASSGRHIVGCVRGGKLQTEEVYRFQNRPVPRAGHLVWDADALFSEILNGLKAAKAAGKTPSYIGIDTWAVDYALLDKRDQRIGDVYCYRDARGAAAAKKVHAIVPQKDLYARTGIQYQPFNTIYQLFDDCETGRIRNAETFLMLPDYFHFLLTGVKKNEYTNATSTGLVDCKSHEWSAEIAEAVGIGKKLFLPLSQPGSVVGTLKKDIAAQVGYDATVVLPATHDTASAVVAAQTDEDGLYISSGTWSLLGVCRQDARTDEDSRRFNYSNEGGLDFTFRYQKNIMGLWMIQNVRAETNNAYTFAELADLARRSPTDVTVDVNDERFLSPPDMTREIERAAQGRLNGIGEIAYCVFNSLAQCYRDSIAQLETLTGKSYGTVNVIGGGCNNALLNELTAAASGKRVIAGPSEATAIGNLAVQMTAAKEFADLTQARKGIGQSFDIKEVGV